MKKRKNIQIDVIKNLNRLNREEEIRLHGKIISFRSTIRKNIKKYTRKQKHKHTSDE